MIVAMHLLKIAAQLVCQAGMMHNQPVELPAARGSENSHTAARQQQLLPSLLIFALAAETVLLDSTDMKSSLHLLRAWFSMTSTRRNSRPQPCCLSPDKPPVLRTAEP